MDRRNFNTLCSGLLLGAASLSKNSHANVPYQVSQLFFSDERPVTLNHLAVNQAYIFNYPFVTTPCFLVRLNKPAQPYGASSGGIGDDHSIVAFSAICSHKMSHPAKPISHISYRDKPVEFYTSNGKKQSQAGIISCCSERSVYDPAKGATVLSGPAPSPLAAITLDTDDNEFVYATGSAGPNQYENFLNKFGFRLAMEHGISDIRARSGEKTMVVKAEEFSQQQVLC